MPSARRQNAKTRRSREMDLMSDFENMNILLRNENANPTERELANTINGSVGNNDLESDLHIRKNSSDGNEIKNFDHLGKIESWNLCKHFEMKSI